jgi:four helix bundle protein
MRKAAFSIALNIAEGKGRSTRGDFARFLGIARGSASELNCCFDYVRMLGYIADAELRLAERLLDEVGRMLTSMMRRLSPLGVEAKSYELRATS